MPTFTRCRPSHGLKNRGPLNEFETRVAQEPKAVTAVRFLSLLKRHGREMTEEMFKEVVLFYLDGEHQDNGDAVAELRADFELEAAELYAEFEERCANALAVS